jgi:polysaccharide pyruvyl transferase WcaK-like protein
VAETLKEIYKKYKSIPLVPYLKSYFLNHDGRCRFYDLSMVASRNREACSPIIQFYSSSYNIGNFLPVLGIRKMLSQTPDTWCSHDKNIDFNFINKYYKCAIIGGAGLLHKDFEPFWEKLLNECKLPLIIWGIGVCILDGKRDTSVDKKIVKEVAKRCDLINVRDDLTADYYGLDKAYISACPTIAYLQDFRYLVSKNNHTVLFSSHEELVDDAETERIRATIARVTKKYKYINNNQQRYIGLEYMIKHYYCKSSLVVSTRLHGAIIAYGLGIPYIVIPRDEKLRAFCRMYSNGVSVENEKQLENALREGKVRVTQEIQLDDVLKFGNQARKWILSKTS